MHIKEVFMMSKELIGPHVKYIKELEKDRYEVHEYKKKRSRVEIYVLNVVNGKIEIIQNEESLR